VPGLPTDTSKPVQLEKPRQEEADEHKEVIDFLASISLQKYLQKFVSLGITDLDTILELQDFHLDAMEIPLGYKLKILKRIKNVREEKGMSVPESRGRPESAITRPDSATSHLSQKPGKSALKKPAQPQLREGEFNEEAGHQSFVNAVNEWRQQAQSPTQAKSPGKNVKFAKG